MMTDLTRRPADITRISLKDGAEVCYWTTELDASEEELVQAMRQVGPAASAVRAYFRNQARSSPFEAASESSAILPSE